MSPSRILKESICSSETINELSPEEETLFYRLMVQCDDFGRLDARPAIVRAKCFPLRVDKITVDQIDQWLKSLVKICLIKIYTVAGKDYLEMITWRDHQQVRANKSKYPNPPDPIEIVGSPVMPQPNSIPIITIPHTGDISCNHPKSDDSKLRYGEFKNVIFTAKEYQKLVDKFGEQVAKDRIENLSEALKSRKGYAQKYTDHYATILSWDRKDNKNGGKSDGVNQGHSQAKANGRLRESLGKPLG